VLLAPAPPRDPQQQALDLSAWRQRRNRRAREGHAKTRRQRLRKTG
jgi:hypothetical protein